MLIKCYKLLALGEGIKMVLGKVRTVLGLAQGILLGTKIWLLLQRLLLMW